MALNLSHDRTPDESTRARWREEEDHFILSQACHRNQHDWEAIADKVNETFGTGRTADAVRNHWHRLLKVHGPQVIGAMQEGEEADVTRQHADRMKWTETEDRIITQEVSRLGKCWRAIARLLPARADGRHRSDSSVRNRWERLEKKMAHDAVSDESSLSDPPSEGEHHACAPLVESRLGSMPPPPRAATPRASKPKMRASSPPERASKSTVLPRSHASAYQPRIGTERYDERERIERSERSFRRGSMRDSDTEEDLPSLMRGISFSGAAAPAPAAEPLVAEEAQSMAPDRIEADLLTHTTLDNLDDVLKMMDDIVQLPSPGKVQAVPAVRCF